MIEPYDENLVKYDVYLYINDEDTVNTVYERFIEKLKSGHQHDIETRTTTYGIHKDDLSICEKDLSIVRAIY